MILNIVKKILTSQLKMKTTFTSVKTTTCVAKINHVQNLALDENVRSAMTSRQVEHDIENHEGRGLRYPSRQKAELNNTNRGLHDSRYHAKTEFNN